MTRFAPFAGVLLLLTASAVCGAEAATPAAWPDFRGPARDGHAADTSKPPTRWSDADRVKWKTAIPGAGHSSPVVAGGRAWLTTATDNGRSLRAVCVDVETGRLVHNLEVFRAAVPEAKHDTNSYASPSPVVEDGRVYVSFGSHGVACVDADTGKGVWANRDFQLDFATGAGSSPVLWGDLLILECDAVNAQYVVALDKATGKQAWRTNRSKPYNPNFPAKKRAFSTATVVKVGGRDVLLSVGAGRAYGYDPATGVELWHVDHPGYSCVARPLYANGLMIFSSGYDKADLLAVRVPQGEAGGNGPRHLTDADVAWRAKKGAPYKPTPTLVDGRLYVVTDGGVAQCLDAKTGVSAWTRRLGQAYSASPLYAGGHLYFFSEKGQVHVLKPGGGPEPQVVAEFAMVEGFMASPAVVGDALILRTSGHLWRVE
jgi:outer membrane protein assembly factor BamB